MTPERAPIQITAMPIPSMPIGAMPIAAMAPGAGQQLLADLEAIRGSMLALERDAKADLAAIDGRYRASARNLLHFIALHRTAHTGLREQLQARGLNPLAAGSDGQVLADLEAVLAALRAQLGLPVNAVDQIKAKEQAQTESGRVAGEVSGPSSAQSCDQPAGDGLAAGDGQGVRDGQCASDNQSLGDPMAAHCDRLLGAGAPGEQPSIMVTLPAEAASRSELIPELLRAGMTMARINCAHDDAGVWRELVRRVRQASAELKRPCRIAVDLAGPKLRTGALAPLQGVLRVKPRRDRYGRLLQPARVLAAVNPEALASAPLDSALLNPPTLDPPALDPATANAATADAATADPAAADAASVSDPGSVALALPVLPTDWQAFRPGDQLVGQDASGRQRSLEVEAVLEQGLLLLCRQGCRFVSGTVFCCEHAKGTGVPRRLVVAALPPEPGTLLLRVGDRLQLVAPGAGTGAGTSAGSGAGAGIDPALPAVSCSLPEVLALVRVGERVLFDDGKISTVVRQAGERALTLEVSGVRGGAARLRADKGINFPDTVLRTPALTAKDVADLAFAAEAADILNFSFVHEPADVEALHGVLTQQGRDDLAVVLKIETRRAYEQLPELLLAAMRHPAPLGVMIARGDLAIECGWESLAQIQQDILRICGAAHVPCIWATQVLDELARHGLPTRAEITDAAIGSEADALMLNKGPNIAAAVRSLQAIVRRSQASRRSDRLVSCLAFRSNCPPIPDTASGTVRSRDRG